MTFELCSARRSQIRQGKAQGIKYLARFKVVAREQILEVKVPIRLGILEQHHRVGLSEK